MPKNSKVQLAKEYLRYVFEWYRSPARFWGEPSLPTVLNLPVTDNCNSRCVMCSVWKEASVGELTSRDLHRILSDPLFKKVRHVGVSGGEPSLRRDLPELVEAILGALPSLRSLSITSHGYHTKRWAKFLPEITKLCDKAGVEFTLNLSIDGIGELHDRIRGIPGAFRKAMRTLNLARELGVDLELQTTVVKQNVYHVGQILRFARKSGIRVIFRVATEIARLYNEDVIQSVALDENERSFLADFFESRALHDFTSSPARRLFYKDLARRLVMGTPRKAPCAFQREGLLLSAHGQMYHCSISREPIGSALETKPHALYFSMRSSQMREALLNGVCPSCVHDQSGAWPPLTLLMEVLSHTSLGRGVRSGYEAAKLVLRLSTKAFVAGGARRKKAEAVDFRRASHTNRKGALRDGQAVIIGAYGGEHVGDAAILGGVVLRLVDEFNIKHAYVLSFRPHRTKRWVRSLDLPIPLEVLPYRPEVAKGVLSTPCTLLVYGGGPLMDLPRLLAMHLETVRIALTYGNEFLIEGVGIGPFKRRVSMFMARKLLQLATRVRIRTKDSRYFDLLKGLEVHQVQDPAFDYISVRRAHLTRLTDREKERIDAVLNDLRGGTLVGISLRPLWERYAFGITGSRLYSVEETFLKEFVKSLVRFSETLDDKITYIFFPMNADQYGFSDLEVGYKIADLVPPNLDFRILEAELGVDGLVYLLKNLDATVTMRFHAAIFALSQGLPTVGIDYTVGRWGKLWELFKDMNMVDQVARVDSFSADWLIQRLSSKLNVQLNN